MCLWRRASQLIHFKSTEVSRSPNGKPLRGFELHFIVAVKQVEIQSERQRATTSRAPPASDTLVNVVLRATHHSVSRTPSRPPLVLQCRPIALTPPPAFYQSHCRSFPSIHLYIRSMVRRGKSKHGSVNGVNRLALSLRIFRRPRGDHHL